MAKGTEKTDGSAALHTRSLRPRKRERPSEDVPHTDSVQADGHQQDTNENPSTVQECPVMPEQTAIEAQLTEQHGPTEEEHAEETTGSLENETVKDLEEQKDTTVPCSNSVWKSISVELAPQEVDQPQVIVPNAEEGDGFREATVEKQDKTNQENQCNTADTKVITEEAAAEIPARKKRRMGMCGLTEKERSHILQAQKRENGQSGLESTEPSVSVNKSGDVVAENVILAPAQGEAEVVLQSCHSEENDRAEDHIAVTASNGTSAVTEPGCSETTSRVTEGDAQPRPERPDHEPKPDPPARDGEAMQENPVDQVAQETKGSPSEVTETPGNDRENQATGRDFVSSVGCSSAKSEETVKKRDESETDALQEPRVTRADAVVEVTADAPDGSKAQDTSSTVAQPGVANRGCVELGEATVTPKASEEKSTCSPQANAAPSAGNMEHNDTRDTTDPFGSGGVDYVSDSQLNTIILIDEEVMEKEKPRGSTERNNDATELICGLVRELSSLNQRVMVTHRELESLRRGSKTSRSSLR